MNQASTSTSSDLATQAAFTVPWSDLAAASQIIQLIVVIVGLLYAKRQLDEAAASRRLVAIKEIVSEVGSAELRSIRSSIYARFATPITAEQAALLDDNDRENIRKLAVAYDRIAFLAHLKVVRDDDLFEFQGEEIRRVWNTIREVIVAYRAQHGRPKYCSHLDGLTTVWNSKRKRNLKTA